MTLLFANQEIQPPPPPPPEPVDPVSLRNKSGVVNLINKNAPSGKQTYAWWMDFFDTVLREKWDTSK